MNKNTEEKRRHSSGLVPFSYYKCRVPEYFANVPLHWHTEFEINYILSGCGEFICGADRFTANTGDIVIIPPNRLHAIYPHDGCSIRYDTIVFSAELLGSFGNDRCTAECIRPLLSGAALRNGRITPSHVYYTELQTTAENIFSCAKGSSARLDMLLKSELLRLFWLLEETGDITFSDGDSLRSEQLRPVLRYIEEHFREELSVAQLAETAHLSRSYFMALFKECAGVSAVEYISQLRIKAACEQLTASQKTIAETASDCGFRNISNFNRMFRRIAGCTPVEYRRLNGLR